MRENPYGRFPSDNYILENVTMHDLNRNLLATVATQNVADADVLKELEKAKANLAEAQDLIARANRFQNVMVEMFFDPIKSMVKSEMVNYADDFDISAYEDDIKNLASEQLADERPEFDIDEYSDDISDVVRQVLSGATVSIDV